MIELSQRFPDVDLIKHEPNIKQSTKVNEMIKHDFMIQYAKKEGATHFILSACDHIYSKESFEYAKKIKADVILTQMFTYYKEKTWRIDPPEGYYMPFIHKMYFGTSISSSIKYPERVDPAVKVNTGNDIHVAPIDQCVLHHYSMIRVDIENKFRNAASSIRWTQRQKDQFIREYRNAKPGDTITYFQGRKILEENSTTQKTDLRQRD
jgi:hypothetical protein